MEPLWILIRGVLAAFVLWLMVVWLVYQEAHSHETASGWSYDASCCHNRDCYPLPEGYSYFEQPDGHYFATWVSPKTGKIVSGVVSKYNVHDTRDDLEHGCEMSDGKPRCLYIHRGV